MSGLIEALNNAILTVGEAIKLRRTVGVTNRSSVVVDILAVVRAPGANEIVGTVQEGDLMCIFSPTEIINAQWPGGHDDTSNQDVRIPSKTAGDQVYARGRWRSVEWSQAFFVGEDGLCRIEVRVRG